MPSNADRAQRWMDVALGRTELSNLAANGNVYAERDTIFSYGHHFPMAVVMRERPRTEGHFRYLGNAPTEGQPRWVLVNGDSYSPSTTQHQGLVRSVVARSGLPSLIIPFTAMNAAGIDPTSIELLEVREDRTERWTERVMPKGDFAKTWDTEAGCLVDSETHCFVSASNTGALATRTEDGGWETERSRHFLGDSIFSAKANGGPRQRWISSFDHQEARPLYFLCSLPRSSKARTVEEGLRDLRPPAVLAADDAGLKVERQGDLFAIPTELTTREVKELTPYGKGRIVKRPRAGVLGTRHSASQIVFATEGRVYARGTMYHEPEGWRPADHARRKLGDGKTWHLLTRNTVPRQQARERSRA